MARGYGSEPASKEEIAMKEARLKELEDGQKAILKSLNDAQVSWVRKRLKLPKHDA